jgi:hypothetical protein
MPLPPIELVRKSRLALCAWLAQNREFSLAVSQPHVTTQYISDQLSLAGRAICEAGPSDTASHAWRDEIARYVEMLRAVRARLGEFELALRIRNIEVSKARARIDALRSWSNLAMYIG